MHSMCVFCTQYGSHLYDTLMPWRVACVLVDSSKGSNALDVLTLLALLSWLPPERAVLVSMVTGRG